MRILSSDTIIIININIIFINIIIINIIIINIRYKHTFGTQTFSESSIWYPNFRNVQFGTPIL